MFASTGCPRNSSRTRHAASWDGTRAGQASRRRRVTWRWWDGMRWHELLGITGVMSVGAGVRSKRSWILKVCTKAMRLGKQAQTGQDSTARHQVRGSYESREQRGRGLQMSEDHGADGVQGLRPGQETARKGPQEFSKKRRRAGAGRAWTPEATTRAQPNRSPVPSQAAWSRAGVRDHARL